MSKIIAFPNRKEIEDKKAMKEWAKWLIDQADDDFCIMFKGKDMESLFTNEMSTNYLIATTKVDFSDDIITNNKQVSYLLLHDVFNRKGN